MDEGSPPIWNESAFDCVHCGAYAQQRWADFYSGGFASESVGENSGDTTPFVHGYGARGGQSVVDGLSACRCYRCKKQTFWLGKSIIYPSNVGGLHPNGDLPSEIQQDMREASAVLHISPRAAMGLLRLATDRLCRHVGGKGESTHNVIESLNAKGVEPDVIEQLHVVRNGGNYSVHDLGLDLSGDVETATTLFMLLNHVAEILVSEPRRRAERLAKLPAKLVPKPKSQ